MAKQIQVQTFGFMQYLDEQHWNWSDAEKQQYFTDSESILKRICQRLHIGLQQAGETGDGLKFEFAGINHNKDTDLVWDDIKQMEVLEPIPDHVHGVVTLPKKRDINVIAQWIGLEPQFIEAPKKGRYGKENMLAYLIHAKQPEKYQYSPKEVQTFGTFDYIAYWQGKKPAWERQKATVQTKHNKVSAHWLVKQVQQGLISMREIMCNDMYSAIYADNMPMIDDAFKYYGLKKGYETLEALERGEFELSVIFVTGAPGSGKTHFALNEMRKLRDENGWRCYQASHSNPMDDYNGEEIVLLDDLRAQSLDATAWLQMLDARTSASIGARYKNKQKAYRVLVITSYLEPYEFFSYVKGTGGANEALDQFIRRLMFNIRVHRLYDGGRHVEIEAIGITPEVIYDINNKTFIPPDESSDLFSNGLPKMGGGNVYSPSVLQRAEYEIAYKKLTHAGYPVYEGPPDMAGEYLRNVIKAKNNPEIDHSLSERPDVGNNITYINEHPEIARALNIGSYRKQDASDK